MYRIGFSPDELNVDALNRSGLVWEKVSPREVVVDLANKYVGVPYKFGSSVSKDSPNSFDCSSLTAYLYVNAGYSIPRICDDQYNASSEVSESDVLPGDLVFFKSDRKDISEDKVGHCGVYTGNGEIVQAGGIDIGYGKVVKEKLVDSKYYRTFIGYRRIINDDVRIVVTIPEDKPDLRNRESLLEWVNHGQNS